MLRQSRGRAAAAALCVLLGACTATSTSSGSGGSGTAAKPSAIGAPVQGLTAHTIKIALVWADLSLLTKQHLAPEIGSPKKTIEATVAYVNAHGGIAGRQVVLTSHVLTATSTSDQLRQACLQATEDDKPFAVIIAAAVPSQIAQCTAVQHPVLTLGMDDYVDSLVTAAQGRLFSVGRQSNSENAVAQAFPTILQQRHLLTGKKIGVIRQDLDDQKELESALRTGLSKTGQKIVTDAVLPCPEGSQTCAQQPAAIQRMQSAGVDTVFLLAQTLPAAATLEAAATVHYKPQWMTWGDNATNTVAKFFANGRSSFDGAYAVIDAFTNSTPDAARCNTIATAGGAERFPAGSDGYEFTAVTCLQLLTLRAAMGSIKATINQATTISALESLHPVPVAAGPPGSLSVTKHHVGSAVFEVRYSAQSQRWIPTDHSAPITING